jgi:hypothetical protein
LTTPTTRGSDGWPFSVRVDRDELADGACLRPQPSCERFAHDDDGLVAEAVLSPERSAVSERYAQRGEVIGRDGKRAGGSHHWRGAGRGHASRTSALQRPPVAKRNRIASANTGEPGHEPIEKRRPARFVRKRSLSQREARGHHRIGVEAEVHSQHPQAGLGHQRGACQQRQRSRDLQANQSRARPTSAGRIRRGSTRARQVPRQIRAQDGRERSNGEYHRDEYATGGRRQEHGCIHGQRLEPAGHASFEKLLDERSKA